VLSEKGSSLPRCEPALTRISADAPRAEGETLFGSEALAGAKQIKLVTRTSYLGDSSIAYSNWAQPTFYKSPGRRR